MQSQSTWNFDIENSKTVTKLIRISSLFIGYDRSHHAEKHENNNELDRESREKHLGSFLWYNLELSDVIL